ncbi:MAG: tetratricopeptide repeat protein [Phormidesmis sp.]
MGIEAAIEYADRLLYERTGRHLSDLQSSIIQQSWQGRTYGQVASAVGYSEGHIKDVASQLWRVLSDALGERITKGNLRSRLINRIKRTLKNAATLREGDAQPSLQTYPQPEQRNNPAFLGRESALCTLHSLSQVHRIMVIQGEGGIGKTTLAQQYCQQFGRVLELLMAKESANITPVESVVEEWLRQNFNEEPGREFGVTLSRLKRHLCTQPVAIFIDNLEPALDSNGQFIAGHRHYVELLRMLTNTSASVIMTSRDRLCEPSVTVHHYRLLGLSIAAWQQFFASRQVTCLESLPAMHRAYGGNAKAMEILCAATCEDFEGELSAYWQENGSDLLGSADLRNLVVSQVNRLAALDKAAYRVFCRLGCYRYQAQPRLKADAIAALMWDIDPAYHRQTLNSLRDRSLLEFHKGEYWLHPVSRAEAIARLRQQTDWRQANRIAAQYWSDRVTAVTSVEEGLQALEAYYHLMATADYDAAAAVLLHSRHNQWQQFLPLASSLYRMGLLQPVINAVTEVLPFTTTESRSELNNILGDVYWITGKIHSAIACQQQTLCDTENRLSELENSIEQPINKRDAYYLKMLVVDAHLSIGLYCIDLWELSQAAKQFEQAIALADGSDHQPWADKASVGLALVQAYLGKTQIASALAHGLYQQMADGPDDQHGRYAYFLQLLGQVFSSLGELQKAQRLYERAIAFAEAGHYVQVKAKALTGLATLQRQRGNYEEAIALHTQAVALCETIGAKCDLAEAYFQWGLSQLDLSKGDRSDRQRQSEHLKRAIVIFSETCAPQQVQRVTQFLAICPE